MYERIIHLITLFNPRDYLHNYLFNNFNQLSKNDWALLKEKRKNLKPEHKLATILQNDDIEALKSEMIHPDFDIDEIIPESFLEPVWMLQHHPSLIQYAAFYNAINCFKYLLMSGANLRYVDSVNRTLPQFAVCNGNIEIFRLCQQFCPIQGADHTAIAFHQNGLFIWLHESYNTDLSQVHPQRGSTLSRIMSEWNYEVLFYVLEKGYDLGFVDTTNVLLYYLCFGFYLENSS
ncbi:hypothetical protein TRFO_38562 [Tritrichomonas foetus]|uniref:Uncharacterized protein n=1 Tax=Tritrichomonas foetus TaxID=1144522 RepID=A0A1J4JAS4_9EUKA|nr:hypothetical protein TRFO_38562 [Tritrichomonas foetus]|eukprot:OHS95327.1 hypothetical protein TRFO_38562 [Tritrichomonas foetus]